MNLKNVAGLFVLACSLVALTTLDATAQTAPTLTVTVSATSVTIAWTGVPGALGYTLQAGSSPGSANIATVNLPASTTQVAVTAPPGIYYLRVRATAGSITGPNSNEAIATVGAPAPCTGPVAPTGVAASVQGGSVAISWAGVAGAQGYRVELSRNPGTTELAVTTTATTLQRWVGMLGTFYARVTAGTACGQATSSEVSFTISSLTLGSGPRTPNPPAGVLLPRPNAFGVVTAVANQFPSDFFRSRPTDCRGTMTFMYRLLQVLRQSDSRWGLNWKRGNRGNLSEDILTYNGTNRPDEGESQVYLFDVIGGACSAPAPAWGDVTDNTWANRGQPYCGTTYCASWTLEPYLIAGFPPDPRPQQ